MSTRKKTNVMWQDQAIVFHFQMLLLLLSISLSLLDAIVIVTYMCKRKKANVMWQSQAIVRHSDRQSTLVVRFNQAQNTFPH